MMHIHRTSHLKPRTLPDPCPVACSHPFPSVEVLFGRSVLVLLFEQHVSRVRPRHPANPAHISWSQFSPFSTSVEPSVPTALISFLLFLLLSFLYSSLSFPNSSSLTHFLPFFLSSPEDSSLLSSFPLFSFFPPSSPHQSPSAGMHLTDLPQLSALPVFRRSLGPLTACIVVLSAAVSQLNALWQRLVETRPLLLSGTDEVMSRRPTPLNVEAQVMQTQQASRRFVTRLLLKLPSNEVVSFC